MRKNNDGGDALHPILRLTQSPFLLFYGFSLLPIDDYFLVRLTMVQNTPIRSYQLVESMHKKHDKPPFAASSQPLQQILFFANQKRAM